MIYGIITSVSNKYINSLQLLINWRLLCLLGLALIGKERKMKDFFRKDNHSIFNKCLSTFEDAIKIVDEMDEEEDINDSLGTLMGNIFPQQDNFDLKKSIIASLLFVTVSCSLIFFYALFGCIITAAIF